MSLDSIVPIEIILQDAAPTSRGFGVPLIIDAAYKDVSGTETAIFGPELVRSYSRVQEMVDDGFGEESVAVRMARALFSQSPSPEVVKIGRRTVEAIEDTQFGAHLNRVDNSPDFNFQLTILTSIFNTTVGEAPGTGYTFFVRLFGDGGQVKTYSYQVQSGDDENAVANGLHNAIVADPVDGLTTSNSASPTVTFSADGIGKTFGILFSVNNEYGVEQENKNHFTQSNDTADGGIVSAYSAIKDEDADFYGVLSTSQSPAELAALAGAVEAESRILICTSGNSDILSGGGLLNSSGGGGLGSRDRTAFIYHDQSFQFADAAWMGKQFPIDPGASTWKFKGLAGITPDKLSTSQRSTIGNDPDARGNFYVRTSGLDITCDGRMTKTEGRFIDVTRGIDWLEARMQERLFGVLALNQKLGYTDISIAVLEGEMRAQLQEAVDQGVLASDPPPEVIVPKKATIPIADVSNRNVPGMFFNGTLEGAIHRIQVQGVVRL